MAVSAKDLELVRADITVGLSAMHFCWMRQLRRCYIFHTIIILCVLHHL